MTLIEGIQISIPPKRRAVGLIEQMEELVGMRRHGRISRGQFLVRWSKLRKALFLTDEYQQFRVRVLTRCGHICEMCGQARAVHVHHTKQVSFYPRLVLVSALANGTCKKCHEAEHDD